MKKKSVEWLKPTPVLVGKNKLKTEDFLYRSKCGRFEIEKRHYIMPYVSVGYLLTDFESKKKAEQFDRLSDAKAWVEDLVTEGDG